MSAPIIHEDRVRAWNFARFHCLPDRQMRERWFSGHYDTSDEGAAIRSHAEHRVASRADMMAALEIIAAGDPDVSDTAIVVGNGAQTVLRQVRAAIAKATGYSSALAALNAETNEMVALSNGRLG